MSILKRLDKILCSLGVADTDVLDKTLSDERRKFIFSAVENIFTSIISASAMKFTFFSINRKLPFIFIIYISFFWLFFCIILNAGLIGSVKRKKGSNSFFSTIGSLLLRICISVIISLGI